jgi:hypothetical protein
MTEEEPKGKIQFIESNDALTIKIAPKSPMAIIFGISSAAAIFWTMKFMSEENRVGVAFFALMSVLCVGGVLWAFVGHYLVTVNRQFVQIRQEILGVPFYSRRVPIGQVTGFCHGIRLRRRRNWEVLQLDVIEVLLKNRVLAFGKDDLDATQVKTILLKLSDFASTSKAAWMVIPPSDKST